MRPLVQEPMKTLSMAMSIIAVPALTSAAALKDGLAKGTPEIKSITAMAFAPEGILLVGDPAGASVFAIDTGDASPVGDDPVNIEDLGGKVAALLGTEAGQVRIADVKVNPASGNVYIGVLRGTGPNAKPVVLRATRKGKLEDVSMENVPFAQAKLSSPPKGDSRRSGRMTAITGLGFADGKVLVSGLSSEEWASTLRVLEFPFKEDTAGAGVEIYHGAHGKFETRSPVRTFTSYEISGQPYVLAAYTCTPLVKFPLDQLKAGAKVRGTTLAELGNRNRPLDMVVYEKGGEDYVLIANSARGVMKVSTEGVAKKEGITERISGTAGLKYQTIESLKGVEQLDKLDAKRAVLLVTSGDSTNLETIELP